MNLAIIPARGGSKRIPRKNIREFCGKPIIAYSIQAAMDAGCFDQVMVSTDDNEIAEVAKKWGASVPFLRSAGTATDYATTADVLVEVLNEYRGRGRTVDLGCCLYPTAPFVSPERLKTAHQLLSQDKSVKVVFPVARFSYPIQRALRLVDGKVSLFNPEHAQTRSQDLEPSYHDVGQFYWFRASEFLESPSLMGPGTAGILLPEWQVQDIDNESDWIVAEMKYRLLQQRESVGRTAREGCTVEK